MEHFPPSIQVQTGTDKPWHRYCRCRASSGCQRRVVVSVGVGVVVGVVIGVASVGVGIAVVVVIGIGVFFAESLT